MASRTPWLLHPVTKAASAEAEGRRSARGVGLGQVCHYLGLLLVPELPAHRTEHILRTGEGALRPTQRTGLRSRWRVRSLSDADLLMFLRHFHHPKGAAYQKRRTPDGLSWSSHPVSSLKSRPVAVIRAFMESAQRPCSIKSLSPLLTGKCWNPRERPKMSASLRSLRLGL